MPIWISASCKYIPHAPNLWLNLYTVGSLDPMTNWQCQRAQQGCRVHIAEAQGGGGGGPLPQECVLVSLSCLGRGRVSGQQVLREATRGNRGWNRQVQARRQRSQGPGLSRLRQRVDPGALELVSSKMVHCGPPVQWADVAGQGARRRPCCSSEPAAAARRY